MPSYQISSSGIVAYRRMRPQYASMPAVTAAAATAGLIRFSRAATTRLAAKRLTSHSNGPGRVSSKSRRSNDRFRSGVAHNPKFST